MDQSRILMFPGPEPTVPTLEQELGSEAYLQLRAEFLDQLPGQVRDLNAATVDGDVPAARYVAHQIKGSALSFGATALDALADRFLSIGKDESELLRPLVSEIERTVDELRGELDAHTRETDVGSDAHQRLLADFLGLLPVQLVDLHRAAEAGNVPAARYVAHQIKDYAPKLGATGLNGLAEQLLHIGDDENGHLRELVAEIESEAGQLQAERGVSTLETDVGAEVYQRLVTEFLAQLPVYLVELNVALTAGDTAGARYVAHQIKGNALSFGAVRLDGLAERMLRTGKDQWDLLRLLAAELGNEVEALQQVLGRPASAG
ncbi:MAG: Hpt domain-containing protein [Mycobacteriales bacterium]